MKYLKIAKELFESSLWNTMSLSENGLLVNLLNKAPFKEVTYMLYGREICLQPLEVCFAQRIIAAKYNLSEYALKKMLNKFQDMGLITIKRRKLSANKQNNKSAFHTTLSHHPQYNDSITSVTSITFCTSVIANFSEKDESRDSDQKKITLSHHPFDPHKYNVFKKINKKQCAGANPENQEFQNPWYALDAFINRTIHDSQAWTDHLCVELQIDEHTLTEAIKHFCVRQKNVGYNQMTKVVFTQQFISYFNKQKHKNNPNNGKQAQQSTVDETQSDTEIDRQLKDLAAKCRRFGRNRSRGDDT